jgi:hypothetical protein
VSTILSKDFGFEKIYEVSIGVERAE